MPPPPTLHFPRLGKQKFAALADKAKSLGMTPQRYVQHLIDEDLALDHQARTTPFAELLTPAPIDDPALDHLVDDARTRHHRRAPGQKKR